MKQMLGTLMFLLFIGVAQSMAQDKLPTEWQPNMTLTVYHGPGMRPEWSKIIISDSACWYIREGSEKPYRKKFKLTSVQLNALLKELQLQQLDKIHSHSKPALWTDKGTTSIDLRFGTQYVGASESYASDFDEEADKQFNAIIHYVYKIIPRK